MTPNGAPAPGRPGAERGPARQASLRRHNLALVLGEIAAHGAISRAELSRRLGLTKATVSSLVDLLTGQGVVQELAAGQAEIVVRPRRPRRGRPANPVAIAVGAPVAVGVEVAVDYVGVCALDLAGKLLWHEAVPMPNDEGDPEECLSKAAAWCQGAVAEVSRSGARVLGVGLALPGVVDNQGQLCSAPNLPRWTGMTPGPALEALLGGTVSVLTVGNEANLAALAELWYGARRGLRDFVLVSGEIGVGAGLVVGGQLFAGAAGAAGELGHVTVHARGRPCGCGSRGCLEQYAGQEALLAAAGAKSRRALLEGLSRREPRCQRALQEAGQALGLAVSALVNVVDVPVVVLGGMYAELAPYLQDVLERELAVRVLSSEWAPVEVVVASLGTEAAMWGAAGSVVHAFLGDPAAFMPELLEGAEEPGPGARA